MAECRLNRVKFAVSETKVKRRRFVTLANNFKKLAAIEDQY